MNNNTWIKAGLLAAGIDVLLSFFSLIPCINCLIAPIQCVSWFVLPLDCGYVAALWANLKRDQYQEAAMQGALSGLVLGIIGGVVKVIVQLISSLFSFSAKNTLSFLNEQDSTFTKSLNFLPVGISSTLLFSSGCCITGIVTNVILSVLGSIIYVALSKK